MKSQAYRSFIKRSTPDNKVTQSPTPILKPDVLEQDKFKTRKESKKLKNKIEPVIDNTSDNDVIISEYILNEEE